MAKKRDSKKGEDAALPKFGGFKPLAGLKELKDKMAAEAKKPEPPKGGRPGPAAPPPYGSSASPPATRRPKPTAASSAEDELTFHRMMAGVTPLDGGHARVPVTAEVAKGARPKKEEMLASARAEATAVLDHLHTLVDDVIRFEVSDDGSRVEGHRVDTPPGLVRSLRRGQLPIDARLDLHGLGANDARERTADFLKQMRTRGERCVLVIHGKGERSGGGVLRGEIAAWLSQGRAREHVAAFATACGEDGGEGAVYVALRR